MFTKLSPSELAQYRATRAYPEYAEFLPNLAVGEGGRVDVSKAGVSRQTVKNRLHAAATATGVKVRFLRRSGDDLVFEVVGAAEAPKRRRGRPPKAGR